MIKIAVTGLRGVPATWGGIEHHCENLYSRLAQSGFDVTIYGRSYYVPEGIHSYKGLTIRRLPTLNLKYTDALFHTFLSLLHLVAANPDIVHIHGIGPCFFSWIPRLFRPKMKVFFTCHGLDWQRKKWPWWASRLIYLGELSAIRFAQYRIVVSRELEDYFASTHHIKTFYIPNGINPVPPKEPDRIGKWDLSPRSYFLCVARIVPEKRLEDVISAYLMHPRASRLVIVGDTASAGQYMDNLIRLAKPDPSIIFTGYQFGAVLEELYSNALAFVTASELEGLPITLLEALSYGKVCITSDIGPHRELVETLPGMTFAVGDVSALAKQMDHVEAMPESRHDQFKEQAVGMISRRFAWETVCREHERLYRASLDERGPA